MILAFLRLLDRVARKPRASGDDPGAAQAASQDPQ